MAAVSSAPRVPYEYALIRVVPRTDRGETLNVGLILYCQDHAVLIARAHVDDARLRALWPDIDLGGVRAAVAAIGALCDRPAEGTAREGGGLGARFRWLTAPRSTVVQTSAVHAGLTDDPGREADAMLRRLVALPGG